MNCAPRRAAASRTKRRGLRAIWPTRKADRDRLQKNHEALERLIAKQAATRDELAVNDLALSQCPGGSEAIVAPPSRSSTAA